MANFKKTDLEYTYSWKVFPDDIKNSIDFLDSIVLNVNEGYEVLHFITLYMADIGWEAVGTFRAIEKILKTELPPKIKTYKKVQLWLDDNFSI